MAPTIVFRRRRFPRNHKTAAEQISLLVRSEHVIQKFQNLETGTILQLQDLNDVLPDKLNDKRRDPLVIGAENICQMLLANKTAVMSCQKALKEFCLNGIERS